MAKLKTRIVPHLWFDRQAFEAAEFYTSVFEDSRILDRVTLDETPSGSVELVTFEILGQEFMAISAGPLFKFNESISFVVVCDTQREIDHYWNSLVSGGGQESQCGWLKDRFGLSWQITPNRMGEMLKDPDKEKVARVTQAFLQMRKLDLSELQSAYNGN